MNTTASLDQMQQLKLLGMHHAYHSQLELPMNQQLEGHELIAHLLGAEQLHRVNEKTTYYLKLAKLRLPATLEHWLRQKLPGLCAWSSGLYPGIQNQLLKHEPVDRKSYALQARWILYQTAQSPGTAISDHTG